MELKLANDEEKDKNEGGFRLSGVSEQQRTDRQQEQENPWDFEKTEEPFVTRSISSSVTAGNSSYSSSVNDMHIIVKLGRFVVYGCMLLMIVSMIWLTMQPKIDIYFGVMKFSPVFSMCQILLIADAILVNVLYERKISLILWAWLFGFIYPIKRDRHVNGGSSWGVLTSVGMLISYVAVFSNFFAAYMNYGQVVLNGDKAVRNAVVEFMEQPVQAGGENFESKLKKNFEIQNINLETQGNQSVIVVQGNGQYGVDTDNFIDYTNKTVATQLAFVKDSSGNYKLGAVVLGNVSLSNHYVDYYWNTLMK